MKTKKEIKKDEFFDEVNYTNPEKYEEQFDSSNDIVYRENLALEQILTHCISEDLKIHDIGCGTGLGRKLLPYHDYIGIDFVQNSIDFCRKEYDAEFICENAESYIERQEKINPIFLFSLDYIDLKTVEKYLQKTDEIFIAIHCNKPYLSQTSVYSNRKETYYELHPREEIDKRLKLFDDYGAKTYRFLDEDYYYLTIFEKA